MPEGPIETSVEHEIKVAAAPETVFAYFTDPARIVRWMGDDATIDPRAGGICRIEINGAVMIGRFVEVDPYERIVLTWGWENQLFEVPVEGSLIEVSFTPDGDDTVVRLVHRRLPTRAAAAFHRAGWTHYLERLAVAAASGDPGADPWRDRAIVREKLRAALAEEAE